VSALEQSLRDLCAKHDLTTININFSVRFGWSAVAHWDNASRCGSSEFGTPTMGAAVASAISAAIAIRNPAVVVELADEALEVPA